MAKILDHRHEALSDMRRLITAIELELMEPEPNPHSVKRDIRSLRSIAYFNFLAAAARK